MPRKILFSLMALALAAATVIGGTMAYFSDREVSHNNRFVVGKFNLKVDNTCHYNGRECICVNNPDNPHDGECYWDIGGNGRFGDGEIKPSNRCYCTWEEKDLADNDVFFNFADVKPGDNGEDTVSLHVINNDAWLCAELDNLANDDNGCEGPEADVDTTCGAGEGELQDNLLFTVWRDDDCDNVLDAGEQVLVDNEPIGDTFWPLADSTTGDPVAGDSTVCYGIGWQVPLETSNIIQSDSLSGDIAFTAVQARHMENFKCSDLGGGGNNAGGRCQVDADCNDGNPCTVEFCYDGRCQHNNLNGATCADNDDNPCTVGVCQEGACVAQPAADGATCDDDNPCTINDSCQSGACVGETKDCDDNNPGTTDTCDADTGECVYACNVGASCDDGDDSTINDAYALVGGACVCQGCTATTYYRDADNDGYGNDNNTLRACSQPTGYVAQGGDCNDDSSFVHPDATEVCDGYDNDCDGQTDPEGANGCHVYYRDHDNDSYGLTNDSKCLCWPSGDYTAYQGGDCNDNNGNINPGAVEACNGVDDNCNGQVDESFPQQGNICDWDNGTPLYYRCIDGHVVCQ